MSLSTFMLLSVPLLPLLLAVPALHRNISLARYLAILPAFVMVFSGDMAAELTWVLLGITLASSHEIRLLLLMSVSIWILASYHSAPVAKTDTDESKSDYHDTFFFLTMGACLGSILATDLVGFFTFSTLMGYGFYGLLVSEGDEINRRARRIYLYFLVVADLLLFEALLIGTKATEDLSCDMLSEVMAYPTLLPYLVLVLLGFALKAGFWPLHFWILLTFRSSKPPAVLLLAAVPVAISLLGIIRWLPLGEVTMPVAGNIIQVVGVIAVIYAVFRLFLRTRVRCIPAYITIMLTGLFNILLGTVLNDPDLWSEYTSLGDSYIVILVVAVTLITMFIHRYADIDISVADQQTRSERLYLWFEYRLREIIRRIRSLALETLPRICESCQSATALLLYIASWNRVLRAGEHVLLSWSTAIILLLLLAITVVLVS